jgi:hypothetical protein
MEQRDLPGAYQRGVALGIFLGFVAASTMVLFLGLVLWLA